MADENPPVVKEGWTWMYNARKWHYFRNGISLCRHWLILSSAGLDNVIDISGRGDACKICNKKRKVELEKQGGSPAVKAE